MLPSPSILRRNTPRAICPRNESLGLQGRPHGEADGLAGLVLFKGSQILFSGRISAPVDL